MLQQIPKPYGSKMHIPPTNYHRLAAQQEPCKKLNEKCLKSFWLKSQENGTIGRKMTSHKQQDNYAEKQE